jgi:hypothetical protein
MFTKTENVKCENCKFYVSDQCHRYPPANTGPKWPVVMPKDWCGEFRLNRKFDPDDYKCDGYKE